MQNPYTGTQEKLNNMELSANILGDSYDQQAPFQDGTYHSTVNPLLTRDLVKEIQINDKYIPVTMKTLEWIQERG